MDESITLEIANLAWLLVPGFIAGWIFYGFTSHPKPTQFERIIQALIFTLFIQVLSHPVSWVLMQIGQYFSLRPWDDFAESVLSLVLAFALGMGLAFYTNNDRIHRYFREVGMTTRTSHPSEWCYVFSEKIAFVVLELNDGRRLYGWPKEWPIEPGKGQFYLMAAAWILEDGSLLDLATVDGVLIPAAEVRWVEFMKVPGEENDATRME